MGLRFLAQVTLRVSRALALGCVVLSDAALCPRVPELGGLPGRLPPLLSPFLLSPGSLSSSRVPGRLGVLQGLAGLGGPAHVCAEPAQAPGPAVDPAASPALLSPRSVLQRRLARA